MWKPVNDFYVMPFKAKDADELDIVLGSTIYRFEAAKHSYTFRDSKLKVAFCAGIFDYWPGMGEAWLIMPKNKTQYIGILKALRTMIQKVVEEDKYFRVQCFIAAHLTKNRNWLEHIGFEFETMLESWYSRGEMCAVYRWKTCPQQ
jgi:hypothetical protein